MANYSTLTAAVQAVVKTNGNGEITGANMQTTLLSMINSLGAGYQFIGVATPSTNPTVSDQKIFYICGQPGTYTNFNNLVSTGIAVLYYDTAWHIANADAVGIVYDISAANGGATYADLATALGNVPASIKRGGMTVSFVQTSDNKYVQYRYMGTATANADFSNVANWQLNDFNLNEVLPEEIVDGKWVDDENVYHNDQYFKVYIYNIRYASKVRLTSWTHSAYNIFVDDNDEVVGSAFRFTNNSWYEVNVPTGATKLKVSSGRSSVDSAYVLPRVFMDKNELGAVTPFTLKQNSKVYQERILPDNGQNANLNDCVDSGMYRLNTGCTNVPDGVTSDNASILFVTTGFANNRDYAIQQFYQNYIDNPFVYYQRVIQISNKTVYKNWVLCKESTLESSINSNVANLNNKINNNWNLKEVLPEEIVYGKWVNDSNVYTANEYFNVYIYNLRYASKVKLTAWTHVAYNIFVDDDGNVIGDAFRLRLFQVSAPCLNIADR